MARNTQQQYSVDRFPGLGGIAKAQKVRDEQVAQREAERIARLAASRREQIDLAKTYRRALHHPVSLEVFDAVLKRFETAEAVKVGGRSYGAVTVATEGVTEGNLAAHFAEGSKVLDPALKGARWAKRALVQSGDELTRQREAEKAAREGVKVSA